MKKPDWRIWVNNKKECKTWFDAYLKKGVLRKSDDESKLHIKKADHNLNFANWIFEKHEDEIPEILNDNFYDWIVNIYYYAIYHAALSLVSKERYSSKGHSATLCILIYYNYHLQNKISEKDVELVASSLNKEDIETLGNSKELRERASYNVHELFEKKLAEQIKEKAVDFTNKMRVLLEENNKMKNEEKKEIVKKEVEE